MLTEKCPKGPGALRSWDGGSPPTVPGPRPPLPGPNMLSILIHFGGAWAGVPVRSASNHRAELNEKLLTSELVWVRGGRGRVHENFPPSGKTLLIEQIWLLTASSEPTAEGRGAKAEASPAAVSLPL